MLTLFRCLKHISINVNVSPHRTAVYQEQSFVLSIGAIVQVGVSNENWKNIPKLIDRVRDLVA